MEEDVDSREKIFHNAVREYIIFMLIFMFLYVCSYATVLAFRRKSESDAYLPSSHHQRHRGIIESEDIRVYRISLWICTFTLAVSVGAVFLLPISIIANEALHISPRSYYLQMINSSLIHGLWNSIFLGSNLSLFVLLPFGYLLSESEGLPGSRKGLMPRVIEASLVLILLSILVCGLAWVASALLDGERASRKALFDVWNFYLPYLYSWISFLGVLLLLICAPRGFSQLFTVLGDLIVKPQFFKNIHEDLASAYMEEAALKRQCEERVAPMNHLGNGLLSQLQLQKELERARLERLELETRCRNSSFCRNLGYTFVILLLLFLTAISVLMVVANVMALLIGIKALPKGAKELVLGISSLSALGVFGAAIEIVVILYFTLASLVGYYCLPLLHSLKPRLHDTPMPQLIANSASMLILTSALPVLARTLGITNFDLIGSFGSMEWLGNFYIIIGCNVVFAVATALCLLKKFSATVREELLSRLASSLFAPAAASSARGDKHAKAG